MQSFLVVILGSILAGAFISNFLARRHYIYGQIAALCANTIVLVLWLLVYRSLPIILNSSQNVTTNYIVSWSFSIDQASWQLCLCLLLLAEALLLIDLPGFEFNDVQTSSSLARHARLPLILILTGVAFLATWSDSLIGLIYSWTLLALIWMLLLWSTAREKLALTGLFWRTGTLLLGVIFLMLASGSLPDTQGLTISSIEWPTNAKIWVLLASFTFLGTIPIFWWRPIGAKLPVSTSVLAHIVPTVAGAALLIRLNIVGNEVYGIALGATLIGLLSLFFGIVMTWQNLKNVKVALPYMTIAQAGLIVMVGVWSVEDPIVAITRVLVLALGTLFLSIQIPRQRIAWFVIVPIAALSGLPLTAGFLGIAPLYDTWLTGGQFLLVLITGMLIIPFTAGVIIISTNLHAESTTVDVSTNKRISYIVGLILPTAGLIALPNLNLSETNWVSLVVILVAAFLGVALSRNDRFVTKVQGGVDRAIHAKYPRNDISRLVKSFSRTVSTIIRGATNIFEGELGMLWVLVLIFIVWLAGR